MLRTERAVRTPTVAARSCRSARTRPPRLE
jgi:hypothetical protein